MQKVLGIITARGGSKRIPRKNIKDFLGKPLLYWTIKTAKESGVLDRLILSTDDEEIAEIGRLNGTEAPFLRPKEIAQDATPTLPVVQHAITWLSDNENYHPDWLILLEPSSPGRRPFHLREVVRLAEDKEEVDSILGISEIPGHYNPFKSLKMDGKGEITRYPDGELIRNLIHHNQNLPPLYFINSAVYALKPKNLFAKPPSLWGERALGYLMDVKYALDIDTPDEWLVAEIKMKEILKEEDGKTT